MRRTTLLLLATGVLSVAGCNQQEDSSKVRAAIEAHNKEIGAAVARGDGAAVAALYSSSAIAMPPNAPPLTSHVAIEESWKAMVANVKGLELTTTEVEAHGDSADEEGTWKIFGPDARQLDNGKYIVVWKRENGNWLLHRDIWNSDNAPPPPAAQPAAAPEAPAGAVPPPDQPPAPPAPPAPKP